MIFASPSNSDIARFSRHFTFVPQPEIVVVCVLRFGVDKLFCAKRPAAVNPKASETRLAIRRNISEAGCPGGPQKIRPKPKPKLI
jgi:hypothetical protein